MRSVARNICALVIAAAVLLVSVTCTSAGCLIQFGSPSAKAVSVKPACCSHDKSAQQQQPSGQENDRCPLCHGPVFVAKIVKSTTGTDFSASHLFVTPIFCSASDSSISTFICATVDGDIPSASPPTLLALHCALQT